MLYHGLAQPLHVYERGEESAPPGPRGVQSSAQRFLLPSLGLCYAGFSFLGVLPFVLCGVLSICGLASLMDSLSLSWAWIFIAAGHGW